MGEQTVKLSTETYERIKEIADSTGQSLRETVDLAVNTNLDTLHNIGQKLIDLEIAPVEVRHENDTTYTCFECGHTLKLNEQLEVCPGCGKKLDWEELHKSAPGWLGWTAIILLALGVLSRTTRRTL